MKQPIDTLRSAGDLAADNPHGVRIRYMAGCRCVPCRAANSSYETERAAARRRGEWNGLVCAKRAVAHIRDLSYKGVGRKQVADAAGLSPTTISLYMSGKRTKVRAMNERKILAVDAGAVADHALVSARPTWTRINWLLSEGFTKGDLALRLGYKTKNLQIGRRRCLAITALKVEQFYNKIRLGDTA